MPAPARCVLLLSNLLSIAVNRQVPCRAMQIRIGFLGFPHVHLNCVPDPKGLLSEGNAPRSPSQLAQVL